jgi:uncharacterized protein (DUF1810 family)
MSSSTGFLSSLPMSGQHFRRRPGYPDDLKLRSSMTLFASVAASVSAFSRVLEQYYDSQPDVQTLELLKQHGTA